MLEGLELRGFCGEGGEGASVEDVRQVFNQELGENPEGRQSVIQEDDSPKLLSFKDEAS